MQTLTSELTTAQQANGQIPAMSAIAYNDVMDMTTLAASGWTPPTGETLLASDSCVINATTSSLSSGILTVFATYETSTTSFKIYYRYVQQTGYTTAANWTTATLLQTITGANNYALWGLSVTSDNYQNSTSDYFCVGINYASYSSGAIFNVSANVYKLVYGASPTSVVTYSLADATPAYTTMYSVLAYYMGGFYNGGIAAHYDSVANKAIAFWATNCKQVGQSSANYIYQGNYKLKYATFNWGISTDTTPLVLPFPEMAYTLGISTIQNNGIYYGAIIGYFQDNPGNQVKFFSFDGTDFNIYPFSIGGLQDLTNSSSSTVYGVSSIKLSLVNLGFDPSKYPTLAQVFNLTYGYDSKGITSTDGIMSDDFIHWGTRRVFNTSSALQMGLFNTGSNYLLLQNTDQDVQYWVRSATTTDISDDLVSLSISKSPDGSPATLTLRLINNYVGASVSNPNALIENGLILMKLGYNTTSGDETVNDGYYYIDNIQLSDKVDDNIVDVTCRDALKLIQLANYPYQLQFQSQTQVAITAITSQEFNTLFSQILNQTNI